jgi:hypothetical protein
MSHQPNEDGEAKKQVGGDHVTTNDISKREAEELAN